MPTTTNYGWTTPADTDLVKDGASAIRTLGTAIDTTVFNNASAAIAKTIVDAKGDLIAATASDTVARLAVGANDTVLTADSSTATGLKWAAPVSGGANWTLLNSGGTSLSGSTTTISGISAKDKILILVTNASTGSAYSLGIRFNTDTGANYYNYGVVWGRTNNNGVANTPDDFVSLCYVASGTENGFGYLLLTGANSSGVKTYQSLGGATNNASAAGYAWGGYYDSSSTISSISVYANTSSFDNGTVRVYTSA